MRPWGGEVRIACDSAQRSFSSRWSALAACASTAWQGSLYVEARVKHHACNEHQQQSRTCAAYTKPRLDLVHFHDQFFLFFGHMGLSAVKEELVVFMHGKGAAVDEQNDQHDCQTGPKNEERRHH